MDILDSGMELQRNGQRIVKIQGFHDPGNVHRPFQHSIMKIVDPAKHQRHAGKQAIPVRQHEIQRIVVGNHQHIEPPSTEFRRVKVGQHRVVRLGLEPPRIHELRLEIRLQTGRADCGLNPFLQLLDPGKFIMIGMQNQNLRRPAIARSSVSQRQKQQKR